MHTAHCLILYLLLLHPFFYLLFLTPWEDRISLLHTAPCRQTGQDMERVLLDGQTLSPHTHTHALSYTIGRAGAVENRDLALGGEWGVGCLPGGHGGVSTTLPVFYTHTPLPMPACTWNFSHLTSPAYLLEEGGGGRNRRGGVGPTLCSLSLLQVGRLGRQWRTLHLGESFQCLITKLSGMILMVI